MEQDTEPPGERSARRSRPGSTTAASMSLTDATCVITGASRGIGRAIATEFGDRGANVVVNYRSSTAEAEATATAISEGPGDATTECVDVADFEAVTNMAQRVRECFGPVDVLVNNAGITRDTRFERMSHEEWQDVVATNLTGTFNCTKAFYSDVKESPGGRIINVASVVAQRGNYGQSNYAASKSGLFGFTRSLARELAPHGSTVNCVAPGFTWTDMLDDVPEKVRDQIREDIPLDRFATAEEVACVVRFLASSEASYLTGEILNINGGMYA